MTQKCERFGRALRWIQRSAARRGIAIARRPRLARPYAHSFEHARHRFAYWITSDTAQDWYADLDPNAPELRELERLLPATGAVIEVGCHHAIHALWMATHPDHDLRYRGFEADPANAVIAHAQIGLNGLCSRMVVDNAIVGDRRGAGWISHRDNHVEPGPFADASRVRAITLDDLPTSERSCDLLKVDIEGYELRALRGASELLATRPGLALEVHFGLLERLGDDHRQLFALLWDLDYRGRMLDPDGLVGEFSTKRWQQAASSLTKTNLFLHAA